MYRYSEPLYGRTTYKTLSFSEKKYFGSIETIVEENIYLCIFNAIRFQVEPRAKVFSDANVRYSPNRIRTIRGDFQCQMIGKSSF